MLSHLFRACISARVYLSRINDETFVSKALVIFSKFSAQIRERVKHIMATRKLFDATARYLTTTHENNDDDSVEKMNLLNSKSMMMKQQLHKQQQQQRANSKIKLEINKRFLVSTLANCAQANRYRDSNSLHRAKEKEDTMMKTPTTCKGGRKKQQQQMKTPGTKKRTRGEDQEEEDKKRRRAGGGGASTSSSSSSSSDENDDDENGDIEDKIRKLLLLSKTKRGRGLIGARMDDVVKGDKVENENSRGSTRKKSSAKKKKEKRRRKEEKKREKKEKKEKSKSSKTREMGN